MPEATSSIDLTNRELEVLIGMLVDRLSTGVNRQIARPCYGFYTKIRSAALAKGVPLPRQDALVMEFLEKDLPFSTG